MRYEGIRIAVMRVKQFRVSRFAWLVCLGTWGLGAWGLADWSCGIARGIEPSETPSQATVSADAVDRDAPSWLFEGGEHDRSPLSFASFLQQESADESSESGDDLSDTDKTLRDALRALSEEPDLERDESEDSEDSRTNDEDDSDGGSEGGVGNRLDADERLPEVVNGRFIVPPLEAPTIATDKIGTGKTPEGFRKSESAQTSLMPESGVQRGLPWEWQTFSWAAANTFSHPRYFEDRMLERHGHEWCHPCLQPVTSGLRFFGTTAILPYLMTVSRPYECESTLGYFRSGTCVPAYRQRPPFSRKAAVVQGLSMGTGVAILP